MAEFVNVSHGPNRFGSHEAAEIRTEGKDTTYYIDLATVPGFPNPDGRRRRRRRPDVGPIQRFFDPEREHPFLKSLMEAVGPILQGFISTQLPLLLGSLIPDDDDE